jgi:hypothetical protein
MFWIYLTSVKNGKTFEGETVNHSKDDKPFMERLRVASSTDKERQENFYMAV